MKKYITGFIIGSLLTIGIQTQAKITAGVSLSDGGSTISKLIASSSQKLQWKYESYITLDSLIRKLNLLYPEQQIEAKVVSDGLKFYLIYR